MILVGNPIPKKEDARQVKNFNQRLLTVEKNYAKNFYVLDTETNGFETNEPIQISAVRFENGKEVDAHNKYLMPKSSVTDSARKTHGFEKKDLFKMKAARFTKGYSEILMNFLNV